MDVLARRPIERLYECEAHSSGNTGHLSGVEPSMIEAVFQDFPGQSGNVRTVSLDSVPTIQELREDPPRKNVKQAARIRPPECESAPIACGP